jgi:hypothetical protein
MGAYLFERVLVSRRFVFLLRWYCATGAAEDGRAPTEERARCSCRASVRWERTEKTRFCQSPRRTEASERNHERSSVGARPSSAAPVEQDHLEAGPIQLEAFA